MIVCEPKARRRLTFFLCPACSRITPTAGFFCCPHLKNVQKRLTQKQEQFCLAYLRNGGNATSAYLESYNCSGKRETACNKGYALLQNGEIRARISQLRQTVEKKDLAPYAKVLQLWSDTMTDTRQDIAVRLTASRSLAKYYERQEDLERSLKNGEILNQVQDDGRDDGENPLDFAECCARAGYPSPYPKQVEMATFVRDIGPRLLLGARGYGKTDYGVICAVAFALLQDVDDTWLIVTKEEQRGKDILGEIARVLEAHGKTLERNNARLLTLTGHTGKDPNVAVLPLRSKSFRGRHPKHIICDDIITPDDVSAAERAKVEAVLAELMKLTQNVILIGQPAHAKDVYAKMRKLSGVRKMELPYGSIPELDHDLEAQRAAGISEASIQASYFLQISESERMPFAGLAYVNFFPGSGAAGFVDPSHEGSDYTAFAVGAMNFDNFIVAGFAWQKAWDDCIEDIVAVMNALKVTRFAFETNGLGKHPVLLLRQHGANVREWKSETNKHGRILNAATFKGHIKLAQYLPPQLSTPGFREAQLAFNNMVVDYEYKAEHDDAPDALASLMQFLGLVKK